jgi:hypothetical protein
MTGETRIVRHGAAPENADRLRRQLYDDVFTKAEQLIRPVGPELGGVDDELEALRMRLRSILKKQGKHFDPEIMLRTMEALNKLIATRYRISKQSQADLADSMAAVLRGIRTELGIGQDDVA